MISRHLCSKGQRFKHTLMKKILKPAKKIRKEASVDISN